MNDNLLQIARESVARFEEDKQRYEVAQELRRGMHDGWERVQCAYTALLIRSMQA